MQRIQKRLPPVIASACARYSEIYVIVSPPRCSSTALARVFWEQPSVRFYSHEPFEVTYYQRRGLDAVAAHLRSPLELETLKSLPRRGQGSALVVKEMPYQVGDHFPILAAMTRQPIVFLMRDPRKSIASRRAKKREVGDDPNFPAIESGWQLWGSQIEWCRANDVPHLLVSSEDFRSRPESVFPRIFERLGLSFAVEMLRWRSCPEIDLDNLGGKHRHLYREVLTSDGLKPDSRSTPALDSFPRRDGWRRHVADCLGIYRSQAASPWLISATADPT